MATVKVSLTLDEDLVDAARNLAGSRGLSGYVNEALMRRIQHDRLVGLLNEMEQEAGPIDDAILEGVREAWPASEPREARRTA
ncbi:MAG: CopG family transcriptional regulator [Acidobacteria bacterium]|nr:MAG: CopG family transcriptional regulator [Acidobacteriota bacterium]